MDRYSRSSSPTGDGETEVCRPSLITSHKDIALILGLLPLNLQGNILKTHTILESEVPNLTVAAGAVAQEGTGTTTTAGTVLVLCAPTVIMIDAMIEREDTTVILAIPNDRAARVGERARLPNDLVALLLLRTAIAMGITSANPTVLCVLPLCNRMRQLCLRIDSYDS
jgi:hypothetical protein